MNPGIFPRARTAANAFAVLLFAFLGVAAQSAGEKDLQGVLDLEGKLILSLPGSDKKPLVLVFMSVECPIANRYAPTLQRLVETNRQANFVLVYPHADETAEKVREHLREYRLEVSAWRDPANSLVKRVGATITPEAVVFARGEIVYRGRIDDRYADWGKHRPAPTKLDLQETLDALSAGKRIEKRITQAVGCYISSVDE